MVQILTKIRKTGNSKAITLPNDIFKDYKIGEYILVNLEVVSRVSADMSIKEYKCVPCGARFTSSNIVEDIYCHNCGSDDYYQMEEAEE